MAFAQVSELQVSCQSKPFTALQQACVQPQAIFTYLQRFLAAISISDIQNSMNAHWLTYQHHHQSEHRQLHQPRQKRWGRPSCSWPSEIVLGPFWRPHQHTSVLAHFQWLWWSMHLSCLLQHAPAEFSLQAIGSCCDRLNIQKCWQSFCSGMHMLQVLTYINILQRWKCELLFTESAAMQWKCIIAQVTALLWPSCVAGRSPDHLWQENMSVSKTHRHLSDLCVHTHSDLHNCRAD